jgi:hypothetical protein
MFAAFSFDCAILMVYTIPYWPRGGGGGCNSPCEWVGEGLLGGGDLGSSPVGEGVRSLEHQSKKEF